MNKTRIKRLLLGEFSLKRVVCSILFIYACLALCAMFFADSIIFQPRPSSCQDDAGVIKLTTSDGVLISAVYLPNPKASHTILFSHGNAEDLGDIQWLFEELRDRGFSVFGYDYHGYGTSQGKPSEANAYRDIDAAYDYLTQKLRAPPNRILLHGRSVGSGPSVDLAARKPVAGLILESPFLSAFRVVTQIPLLPFDKFRNMDKIHKVQCPLLVMHGREDEIVPFWHGQKLFKAAKEPKRCLWVDRGGHNDLTMIAEGAYYRTMVEFMDLVRASSGP